MKRIVVIIALLFAGLTAYAQESVLIPTRETVVVDNFTAVPDMTLGLYQYARKNVLDGLAHRRINVIDVEADGIGRADIVYPSYRNTRKFSTSPYDINRVAQIMNSYPDARWYVTVYISRFKSYPVEHKSKDKDGNPVVKTDFSADMDAEVYLFDTESMTTQGPIRWHYSYPGAATQAFAEQNVINSLASKARSFVPDHFRFKASILKLGEYNKRGKLEDLYLSCGSNMDLSNGDVFYIFEVSEVNGVETAHKIGKVKVREITGPESCRCSVSNGEAEINSAFLDGRKLVAVSDEDRYF